MTLTGNGKSSWLHQIGVAVVDELVDHAVDERADQLGLPPLHRLPGERLLQHRAVRVVFGLVHLEDGCDQDRAHDLGVARRS